MSSMFTLLSSELRENGNDKSKEKDKESADFIWKAPKYYSEFLWDHPHIIFVTLLIFAIVCTSGILLILFAANAQQNQIENEALNLANNTGQWFSDQLDRAILPLFSMAQFVTQLDIFHDLHDRIGAADAPGSAPFLPPRFEDRGVTHRDVTGICDDPILVNRFNEIAKAVKEDAKMEGVLITLELQPHAAICLIYPLNNTEDFEPPAYFDNTGAIGLDLLRNPTTRHGVEQAIPKSEVSILGPRVLLSGCSSCDPKATNSFLARLPVKMEDKKMTVNGRTYPRWGFVTAIINWYALIGRSDIYNNFEKRGFGFQLTRTDGIVNATTNITTYTTVTLAETPDFGEYRSYFVTTALDTTNSQWEMTVEYNSSSDQWKPIGIVITIFFAIGISIMAATILIQKANFSIMHKRYMEDLAQPQKLRLRIYLEENAVDVPTKKMEDIIQKEKPIADVFLNTTVLFADIVGFTAWSSEREPTQVFIFLQAIFYAFDQIAIKRGVFKIENTGDSYIAVTGVPDAQPDHAIRMAKFARECLIKSIELTKMLETTLGPDTSDLGIRFGLHSGPVTAGVLIGKRSNIQLFGETVNTAARMESTGEKNLIHLSQATANLLIEAGKVHWIEPRKDQIVVKGKGLTQTYFLVKNKKDKTHRLANINSTVSDNGENSSLAARSDSDSDLWGEEERAVLDIANDDTADKIERLVEWQVDSMTKLLKQIVSKRRRDSKIEMNLQDPSKNKHSGATLLDEVKEVITLPKFDNKQQTKKLMKTFDSVPLNPSVTEQLRDYVYKIANLYHNNPFHNFEHASHVTMSVHKLLNRVATPEKVDYERLSAKAIAADMHTYTFGITSDPLTHFAVVFSALIHDADHTGVSNGQLAKEHPELAEKYRNQSIAEQNSVDIAWDILMSDDYCDLRQCIFMTQTELDRFRQLVVNVVLATDIFDLELKALRNSRWDRAFHPVDHNDSSRTYNNNNNSSNDESSSCLDSLKWNDTNRKATIVIEHIIQASDVAHTMQHWHIYKKWNERLFQEMYLAWKMGRSIKDPSEGWYNGEIWFFDNYVIPLARKLKECGVFGIASDECLFNALENRREWASKGESIVSEMKMQCQKMDWGDIHQKIILEGDEEDDVTNANDEDNVILA